MKRREFLCSAVSITLSNPISALGKPASGAPYKSITLAAVGDCMITRPFDRQSPGLQPLLGVLRDADLTFGNFEMTLPDPEMYPASTGVCGDLNNSAEGPMPEELRWAGFKIMGLPNNHMLDYGVDGMFATARKIGAAGIAHAGTGRNLAEARAPAFYDSPGGRGALIACASSYRPGSQAADGNGEIPGRPGLNPLHIDTSYHVSASQLSTLQAIKQQLFPDTRQGPLQAPTGAGVSFLDNQFVAEGQPDVVTTSDPRDLAGIVASIRRARRNADLVMVSIHSHEAHGEREIPATFLPEFAHASIDAGAHAFMGHGPHVLRGIEIYKGKPIFYSLGNFIFEAESMRQVPQGMYDSCQIAGADPSDFFDRAMQGFHEEVYWQSVIAQAEFVDGDLSELRLIPIDLQRDLPRAERGMPIRANAQVGGVILDRLARLSEPFGTKIIREDGIGVIRPQARS